MKTKNIDSIDVSIALDQAELLRHKYLHQRGWEFSCNQELGGLWRWTKKIRGKYFLEVEVESAFAIQKRLDGAKQ